MFKGIACIKMKRSGHRHLLFPQNTEVVCLKNIQAALTYNESGWGLELLCLNKDQIQHSKTNNYDLLIHVIPNLHYILSSVEQNEHRYFEKNVCVISMQHGPHWLSEYLLSCSTEETHTGWEQHEAE